MSETRRLAEFVADTRYEALPTPVVEAVVLCHEALVGFQGRGFADVVQPNCCPPFLLEALLFQWP